MLQPFPKMRAVSSCRFFQVRACCMSARTESILDFILLYSDLVRDLTEKTKKYDSKDASLWLARVRNGALFAIRCFWRKSSFFYFFQALQYNVPRGKKNRGLATVQAYKSLVEDQKQLTPENVRLSLYLGWCIEMVCTIVISNFSQFKNWVWMCHEDFVMIF